jgi:hypothetical protein
MKRLTAWLDAIYLPRNAYIYLLLATPLSYMLGLTHPYLLPFFNALFIYPLFLAGLRRGNFRRTLYYMLLWAVYISIIVIALTFVYPDLMKGKILWGDKYRTEMFSWIRSGKGAEGDWHLFLPQHLWQFGLFLVLSAASIGLGSLVMGALLMNYMNYYVGHLFLAAKQPLIMLFLCWPPWSLLRVIGFIMVALAAAYTVLQSIQGKSFSWAQPKKYFLWSLILLLADILLKLFLASYWQKWLKAQFWI